MQSSHGMGRIGMSKMVDGFGNTFIRGRHCYIHNMVVDNLPGVDVSDLCSWDGGMEESGTEASSHTDSSFL